MNESDNDPGQAVMDSGLLCLIMLAKLHGIAADAQQLRHRFGRQPFGEQNILLAARMLGMKARCIRQHPSRLERTPLPAIGVDHEGRFFVLAKIESEPGQAGPAVRVLVQQAGQPPQVMSRAEFVAFWSGKIILMASKATYAGEASRFDFTWFIPAVVKYRKVLGEVLLISLVLQLIGLVTPCSSRW
jgi:subfamily B ATP-binding cassette protein HlyB/CyaB